MSALTTEPNKAWSVKSTLALCAAPVVFLVLLNVYSPLVLLPAFLVMFVFALLRKVPTIAAVAFGIALILSVALPIIAVTFFSSESAQITDPGGATVVQSTR